MERIETDWCRSCGNVLRGLLSDDICPGCQQALEAAEMEKFELDFVETPEDFAVRVT